MQKIDNILTEKHVVNILLFGLGKTDPFKASDLSEMITNWYTVSKTLDQLGR